MWIKLQCSRFQYMAAQFWGLLLKRDGKSIWMNYYFFLVLLYFKCYTLGKILHYLLWRLLVTFYRYMTWNSLKNGGALQGTWATQHARKTVPSWIVNCCFNFKSSSRMHAAHLWGVSAGGTCYIHIDLNQMNAFKPATLKLFLKVIMYSLSNYLISSHVFLRTKY